MVTELVRQADQLAHPKYRPDIDGLRAVAVLSVVAFHAFPYLIRGGYIGVDVFFVISGFLISGIIFDALETDGFSVATFYSRRIRRIFPALILVLAFSYVCGWFVLAASDYMDLGKEIAGGAGFIANIIAWNETGYFANASETQPLLHLWSLGIEEQFYAVWPLVVYLAWRWRFNWLLVTCLMIAASFAIEVFMMSTDAVASFYSPQSRFWELLVGSALAYLTRHGSSVTSGFSNTASFAGLALIAAGMLVLNKDSTFPGWWALLPTIGAFLVIFAGSQAWANRHFLSNSVMKWFGVISYPLYLWHWPLLTFVRILQFGTPSRIVRIGVVLTSMLLAWLTYRLVERPIRTEGRTRLKVAVLCGALGALFLVGYWTYVSDGLAQRSVNRDERALFMQHYEEMHRSGLRVAYHLECDFHDFRTGRKKKFIDDECVRAGPNGTWLLWGDSHAQALSHGLRRILPSGVRLAQVTTSSCKPALLPRSSRHDEACRESNQFALAQIAKLKPEIVILAQKGNHALTDWEAMADSIRAAGGGRVVLVGPLPEWDPSLPQIIAKYYWGTDHERVGRGLETAIFDTNRRLVERYGASSKLAYVSLIDALCNTEGCLATIPGTQGYNLMAVDYGHLTPDASVFVAKQLIAPILKSLPTQ